MSEIPASRAILGWLSLLGRSFRSRIEGRFGVVGTSARMPDAAQENPQRREGQAKVVAGGGQDGVGVDDEVGLV